MALAISVFLSVSFLPQSIAVIVIGLQSALHRHQNKVVSLGNFKRHVDSHLAVTPITSILVENPSQCLLKCVNEPRCYLCNTAAYSANSKCLYLCELLATEKIQRKNKVPRQRYLPTLQPLGKSAAMITFT